MDIFAEPVPGARPLAVCRGYRDKREPVPLREGACQRRPSYKVSPALNDHTRRLTPQLCLHISVRSCSLQPCPCICVRDLLTWLCPEVSFTTSATLDTTPFPWTRLLLAQGPLSEDGENVGALLGLSHCCPTPHIMTLLPR